MYVRGNAEIASRTHDNTILHLVLDEHVTLPTPATTTVLHMVNIQACRVQEGLVTTRRAAPTAEDTDIARPD